MKRTIPAFVAGTFAVLSVAAYVSAQAPAPADGAAAGPAQISQPAAAQPPDAPAAPVAAPPGSLYGPQGRGGARAVIAGPIGGLGGGGLPGRMIGGFGRGPEQDDPEMAKLNQTEHELDQQSRELINRYASTEDEPMREKMKTMLRETLDKQFDLQNQRRELELKRIEERLSKLREQLKKRSGARVEIVDLRLQQIISEADGLGWAPPAAANVPFGRPMSAASAGPAPRPQYAPARAR